LRLLDGFFAALICGPDNVLPSEYLPEIWGGDNEPVFETKLILHEFISLITRHWNATCHTLQSGAAHGMPVSQPVNLADIERLHGSWSSPRRLNRQF